MGAEHILAAIGLVACAAVLLGMLLGPARRTQLQAWARRQQRRLHHLWQSPRQRRAARAEAEKAIDRARRAVERDGNVYRPKSFNGRPPDDELH